MGDRIVHVVGTGTIGGPLIGILASLRERFGIDEVTFHKRSPLMSDRPKVWALEQRGAKLCVDREHWQNFKKMGMEPSYESEEAIERAKVIIDCTPAGNENKEKFYQRYANNGRGFIAQGGEFGFGKRYARGINDDALIKGIDRFIQVVSCNTHNLAVLIDSIALGPEKENNLEEGLFVCMRRANDISQEGGFIPAPEVERHDDPRFGTHQGRDVHGLFQTLGLDLNLYSSVLKVNTQSGPRTARGLVIFVGSGLMRCLLCRWVLPEKESGNLKLAFLLSLRGQSLRTPVDAPPQSLVSASSSTRFR